jgi:hypothetical protein
VGMGQKSSLSDKMVLSLHGEPWKAWGRCFPGDKAEPRGSEALNFGLEPL